MSGFSRGDGHGGSVDDSWNCERLNHRKSEVIYLTPGGDIQDLSMNKFAKSAFTGTRLSFHEKKTRLG